MLVEAMDQYRVHTDQVCPFGVKDNFWEMGQYDQNPL